MKKLMTLGMIGILLYACTSNTNNDQQNKRSFPEEKSATSDPSAYDPQRGEGKFDAVEVGDKLDVALAKEGKTITLVPRPIYRLPPQRQIGRGTSERR